MGGRHADIIAATEGAEVAMVYDTDGARAGELAGRMGVPSTVEFPEILANDAVDAVVLCTPSSLHAEYGIAAARAGKDIMTEKPIDTVPSKARELIAAARDNQVCLSVISQNRWCDGAWALKQALNDGVMGRPLLAHVSVCWHRDDRYYTSSDWRGRWSGEGGGVLMNQGIHYLDLLLWYLGDVKNVRAGVATSRPVIETEDVAACQLEFENHALATVDVTTCAYPGFPERLELHCTEGTCVLESGGIRFWKTRKEDEPPAVDFPTPTPQDLLPKYITFQRQYRDFLQARANGTSPVVLPEQALAVLDVVHRIYASAGVQPPES